MKLLLTGRPGIGKTTEIKKLVNLVVKRLESLSPLR